MVKINFIKTKNHIKNFNYEVNCKFKLLYYRILS